MTDHFNGLTPAEAERLAMLAEEAGEIVQAVGKIQQHGFESCHPNGGPTNRDELIREITDFLSVVQAMMTEKDLPSDSTKDENRNIDAAWSRKLRYAHHQ